ncbi:major capsid protein [Microviridae sp.]|nr:major capsid protein [Microviridae sp.]
MAKNRRNRSVMTHQFSQVPSAQIPRSSFNRSHGLKTTFDADGLVPIFVDEVLPGDTFNLRGSMFGRLATPIKPVMDNLFLETFFFFVPYRLVWDNWHKFNGEQTNPGDSTDYTIPVLAGGSATPDSSLRHYMGLPVGLDPANAPVSALPFRAYNLIWDQWFRDQNLTNAPIIDFGDGPDSTTDVQIKERAKRHDYFTSALPFPQKGEALSLPIGATADIRTAAAGNESPTVYSDAEGEWRELYTEAPVPAFLKVDTVAGSTPVPKLYADLSEATTVTINDMRQAFQIQRLLERDARGGSRYTEIIRSHFGVVSPDARLQRPEFLGGGTSMIAINPVAQNTPSDIVADITPQGNLAAYGTVAAQGHGFTKSFTEHGVIIGLVNVRADITYQQGLNRMWSRRTRYDFYWPALSHLGEQAILSREIYADGTAADDDVFGYQEAFAEYRYKPSQITGRFASAASAPLDIWHLSEEFATRPVLNNSFIRSSVPLDRVIAVQDEPHILLDCYFSLRCARPMPLYGVPGLIDHF